MTGPVPLVVHRWGDAEPTVLGLHGLGSAGPVLGRVAADLVAAGRSVAAVDLRGHGATGPAATYELDNYARDVLATCPGPWDLVIGHSLGGAVCVAAADIGRAFARRLLLVDPAIEIRDDEAIVIRDRLTAEAAQPPTVEQLMADHPRWHRDDAIEKREAVMATTPEVIWRTFEHNLDWDLWDRLASLTIPVHVVAADPAEGALFRESHGRRLHAVKPDLTYEVAVGAGHSVFRDDVAVVSAAALRLL